MILCDMPDRLRARAVLAALLILLTVAGIRAVGPAVGWDAPARTVLVSTGCAVEAVAAGLLVALHWRRPGSRRQRGSQGRGPGRAEPGAAVAFRLRRILDGVLIGCLVAIPAALLFAVLGRLHRTRPLAPALRRTGRPRPARLPGRGTVASVDLAFLREILFAVVLAAIIVTAIWILRWHRSRFARARIPVGEPTDTPADLARAVESGRLALRELDDARAAIIRCYLAMERSLDEAGATRQIAETPDELLARAVAGGIVHGAAAARLTALFYEARFSSHPMPTSQRDQAEQALADLAASLPGRAPATAAADPGGAGE